LGFGYGFSQLFASFEVGQSNLDTKFVNHLVPCSSGVLIIDPRGEPKGDPSSDKGESPSCQNEENLSDGIVHILPVLVGGLVVMVGVVTGSFAIGQIEEKESA